MKQNIFFLVLILFVLSVPSGYSEAKVGKKIGESCREGNYINCKSESCQGVKAYKELCAADDDKDCKRRYSGKTENWKVYEGEIFNYCYNTKTNKRKYPNDGDRAKIGSPCRSDYQCTTAACAGGMCSCYYPLDCKLRYGGKKKNWECIEDEYSGANYCKNKKTGNIKKPSDTPPETDAKSLKQSKIFDEKDFVKPGPEINIPGLELTPTEDIPIKKIGAFKYVIVPYLGEYIAAVYKWSVAAAGLIAVIVILISGIQWMFPFANEFTKGSGDQKKTINQAKQRIIGALTGLILAVGSYTILYTINPNLVKFDGLKVRFIQEKQLKYKVGGDTSEPLKATPKNARKQGFHCPGSGGSKEIPKIVKSMKNKVAYRWGAKGGEPPYTSRGNQFKDKSPKSGTNKGKPFYKFCPNDNVCLDCSGFINYVYMCAGLESPGWGTKTIFNDSKLRKNIDQKIDFKESKLKEKKLKPGDLLGWKEGDGGKSAGHVIMYIGNNKISEASGGRSGRQSGSNPVINHIGKYKSEFFPEGKFRINKVKQED